ncbi:hypothetical protein BD413DRAFT_18659 [Trametes elegans]|nr:hypothetical protein BD413DRAFT_18659 [Trametes elegans]
MPDRGGRGTADVFAPAAPASTPRTDSGVDRGDKRPPHRLVLVLRYAMLATARRATSTVLSQWCGPAARAAQHTRTLATSSVLREDSTTITPAWVKTTSAPNQWRTLFEAVKLSGIQSKLTPDEIWRRQENAVVRHLPRPHDAYSGRSVAVQGKDVSRALTKLKRILTVNNVRATSVRDERHEKKGEKRNRLRSLRWRRRFAHEVRKKVQLVNEIRARGA